MTAPDVRQFRETRRRKPMAPYENLSGRAPETSIAKVQKILKEGWGRRSHPAVDLTGPIPWEESAAVSRTWSFYIHCWDPIHDLLMAYSLTGERAYFDPALRIARDWVTRYAARNVRSAFAWYDMAVGLRAGRLAYILDAAARMDDVADGDLEALMASVELHRTYLADDAHIAFHSNHGFYQAAGQLLMAARLSDLPGMREARRQGEERFKRMLAAQFTEEGVHREHSPDYHRMVYDSLRSILDSGLVADPEVTAFALRVEETLAWFILPNGYLVNFGDSDYRLMARGETFASRWKTAAMRFMTSGGELGTPLPSRLAGFPKSGYFIGRDSWPKGPEDFQQGSYLAQTLCFHSRTHKHADDLSFVWYDGGTEILVDAGRYGYPQKTEAGSALAKEGYWYSDPRRIYVEETRAHNTVEIDGRSSPRHKVKPYGSALRRWGETGEGIMYCESHAYLFKTIGHARVLAFHPGKWLLVFDWMWDNVKKEHEFRQWFHFAPTLSPSIRREQLVLNVGTSTEPLRAASLLPGIGLSRIHIGETVPHLQGWWSPKERTLIPNAAVAFEKNGMPSAVFATLFAFGETLTPDRKHSRVDTNGRKARFHWTVDGRRHELHLLRPKEGEMRVEFEAQ